ncbi:MULTISPECIES: DUF1127 domain-containing protein [Nitrincola]|uniref:YjiS-like domain-containing protein n=1 Tax=Nitrincola nitratireducens TaxID=1229521 RepID=W9UWK5_9GAMM|nr:MULTISPECIES: DUF1127 domain-containing protein [Nitrincola]EXJ11444.1 hypothetical protein D791_01576 [Nitrincola nitratireducens]
MFFDELSTRLHSLLSSLSRGFTLSATEQSLSHLDERLLNDIGLTRSEGAIRAIVSLDQLKVPDEFIEQLNTSAEEAEVLSRQTKNAAPQNAIPTNGEKHPC